MSGSRTWMVGRSKGICSIAISASLLGGVPVVGMPGPGHHGGAHAARGGSALTAPSTTAATVAPAQQPAVRSDHGVGHAYGHDRGGDKTHGPWSPPGGGTAPPGGGTAPPGGGTANAPWNQPASTQSSVPTPSAAPPAPPVAQAPAAHHKHVVPTPEVPTTTTSTPAPATPAPATPAPNAASNQASSTPATPPIPTDGPGDAHNAAHANSNNGGPTNSHGQGNGNSNPCDGLCHGGQNPNLSSATPVALPSVAVNATPIPPVAVTPPSTPAVTPPTVTPPTVTPPTVPTTLPIPVSLPTLPGLPRISNTGSPTLASTPVGLLGARTGFGTIGGITAFARATASGTGGRLGLAGAFTSATGGLGRLGALSSTAALTPAAAATATGTSTGTNAAHHPGSSSHGGGTTILFIPHFINHIPEGVWIALGASLLLAALAAGAAFVSRRRAAAQAGELAAVSAAALTDPLTGVLNRRGFIEAVERELARARRYHHPFVLAYVDVRGLKNVNDTEGHLTGDTLLKNVAALMTDCARADDVVGRLGGDELGLLLVEQTPDAAKVVTRRMEEQVASRRKAMNLGSHWDLTIGTAAYPQDGQSVDELLGTADRRLYQQRGIQLVDSSR